MSSCKTHPSAEKWGKIYMEKPFWFAKCVNVNYFIGLLDSYRGGNRIFVSEILTDMKNYFLTEVKRREK